MKDPYIQPKTGVLKNKLGITDYNELVSAEKDITFSKFLNIGETFNTKFDIDFFKSIHKHIFEDIFDWAGEFRNVPIVKEEVVLPGLSLDYAKPKEIPSRLKSVLEKMNSTNWESMPLEEKSAEFTRQLAQLWLIHPFRDGNTRTTLTFATIFSREHGFPIDIGSLLDHLSRKTDENGKITRYSIRDKFVLAAIPEEYSPEPEHLTYLIHKSIVSGISKKIEKLQKTLGSSVPSSDSPSSSNSNTMPSNSHPDEPEK